MKPEDPSGTPRDEAAVMRALHRRASGEIDAAPDASVRAAVLAAAARAVDARPRDPSASTAGARDAVTYAAPDPAPFATPFGRRRWPVSMAALLVVSLMTGLIVQAMRDDPERITSATRERTMSSPQSAPVPSVPAPSAPPTSLPSTTAPSSSAPPSSAPAQSRPSPAMRPNPATVGPAAPSPAFPASDRAAASMAKAAPESAAGRGVSTASPRPEPQVGPPPIAKPERRAADRALASEAASPSRSSADDLAVRAPSTAFPATPDPAPATIAPAPPPAAVLPSPSREVRPAWPSPTSSSLTDGTPAANRSSPGLNTAQRLRRGAEPLTPEAWLERIVGLRDAGDTAAADREVEALHARYPAFEIPAAALGPAGTR